MKDVVHETLENSRGIVEAKWYHHPFKKAIACPKGGFPSITISNVD
jgi:hypothetical protein